MERFNSELYLTTSQVAELLSVHPSTVKRWCNEKDLEATKTGGGHRRLHLQDVLELARERSIQTYLDPFAPFEGHVWTAMDQVINEGSFEGIHSLAMGWLTRGQIRRLTALFRELGRHPGVSFSDFCDRGIRGFMREVGETWRAGKLRVGEEHMASEALIEVLIRMREHTLEARPSDEPRRTAIVGSMEGDRHNIGGLCVRLLLERHGWKVYFLGPDVPVEDFAAMQKSRDADLVCISFAPPNTAADMKRAIRILGEFYDRTHPYALALGGDLSESPFLDDLDLPFRELGVFGSMADFDRAIAEDFGPRTPEIAIDDVA